MCVTNNLTETTLKMIRKQEEGKLSISEQAKLLANIKVISDCLDKAEKIAKNSIFESDTDEVFYVPEIEKKVYIVEGRKTTTIENNKAVEIIGMDRFVEVSKIVQSNLTEDEKSALIPVTIEEYGKPSVTVRNMNKKELVEHKI